MFAWLRTEFSWWGEAVYRIPVVAAALLTGTVFGAPVGQGVYQYTWADARFCDDCHVHDYANEAWEASIHRNLTTCHDCHRVPIRHYPKNLWMAAFDRPQGEDDIHPPDVETVVCEQCHSREAELEELTGPMSDELRELVVKIDASPLHRVHLDAEARNPGSYRGGNLNDDDDHDNHESGEPINCMDCHGAANNRAHRFESTAENCLGCHEDQKVKLREPLDLDCRECHFQGFLGTSEN